MAASNHDTLALRLADTLRLLQSGERPTHLQLAERFGISERTIYRDLNRLGDVIELGANGVYQLARHYCSSLSPVGLQTFARISGVEQLFPANDRRSWLDLLKPGPTSFLVRDGHFAAERPDNRDFRELGRAIEQKLCCQLSYTGKQRRIEHYRLIHNRGIWYLAATEDGRLKSFAFALSMPCSCWTNPLCPTPPPRRRSRTTMTSGSAKTVSRSPSRSPPVTLTTFCGATCCRTSN